MHRSAAEMERLVDCLSGASAKKAKDNLVGEDKRGAVGREAAANDSGEAQPITRSRTS
jgi:hypothetical protein